MRWIDFVYLGVALVGVVALWYGIIKLLKTRDPYPSVLWIAFGAFVAFGSVGVRYLQAEKQQTTATVDFANAMRRWATPKNPAATAAY